MNLSTLLSRPGPIIMGILNLTPDSFSDGGIYLDPEVAVLHAREMVEEGAAIIDVGGESTRPGSERVPPQEQIRRVVDPIRAIRSAIPEDVLISIDTTRADVAAAALEAGASILNDVSAGRDDAGMFTLAAERELPLILMHMQGEPKSMQEAPCYDDVVAEVKEFLLERAEAARSAGVARERIVIDPGIGFGKTREHNMELMRHLEVFVATGYPVLLGASRKRFMGSICHETEPASLLGATCATTVLGVQAGVRIFRVHDVRPNRQAAELAFALGNGKGE